VPPTATRTKKVAAAVLATPRVRSAIETLTLGQWCHPPLRASPPAPDATLRLPRLHPSRLPSTRCRAHEPTQTTAATCTMIPRTAMIAVATTGPAAMRSPRCPRYATRKTERRVRIRTGRVRGDARRARSGREVCRKLAATGATLSTVPSRRSGASAGRLAATAFRSFQDRQERP
jgi:hypothetical protein